MNLWVKEFFFWVVCLYEKYCDVIYDFVVKKWVDGFKFYIDDDDVKKVMKLLMVVFGKLIK